ncbi:hypothetical protein GBA52_024695 [Prunus armeniaca]|nr:hypothetical protein GBA52_024695 [Prunus armeniaca]
MDSTQALELKSYQLDCYCTEAFQAWWDHYQGRFGAIEAAYKKVFEGCPFRRELGNRKNQALLAQLEEDNKLPMTIATSHKITFRPFKELATEKGKATGEGSGFAGPKVLIFVQRKRNLVKTTPSPSLVAKVTSPSKTSKLDSIVPLSPTSSGRVLTPQPQLQDEVACPPVLGLFDRLRGFFPNSTPQPQEPVGEDGEHATDVVNPESQNLLMPPSLKDANLKLLHQHLPQKPPMCLWKGWRPMCLGIKMLSVPLCPRKKERLKWKDGCCCLWMRRLAKDNALVGEFKKCGASSQETSLLPELNTKLAHEKEILEDHQQENADNEAMLRQVNWRLKTSRPGYSRCWRERQACRRRLNKCWKL